MKKMAKSLKHPKEYNPNTCIPVVMGILYGNWQRLPHYHLSFFFFTLIQSENLLHCTYHSLSTYV